MHSAHGLNTFLPKGTEIEKYEISVYDNCGNIVWFSDKLTKPGQPAEGWNGIYNGKILETGCYIWKVEVTFKSGAMEKRRGSVTLLR